MAHRFIPTPVKTYATEANAVRAVEKRCGPNEPMFGAAKLHYVIMTHTDGRFFPLFIGERATQAQLHFHFNVLL